MEMWLNAGITMSKAWHNTNMVTAAEAWRGSLTMGCKAPSGKGGRVILIHTSNQAEFVDVFIGKKSEDYHGDMFRENYENYFSKQLFPNIPPNSGINLDNTLYHSVKTE